MAFKSVTYRWAILWGAALFAAAAGHTRPTNSIAPIANAEMVQARLTDLEALRYIASHPDLIAAFGADAAKGRAHYETWGIKEGRRITFDPLRYIASHADLIVAFGIDELAATRHYINYGFKEKRPTDLFDANTYLRRYADVRAAFGMDFVAATKHYIQFGFKEGRIFSPILDVELDFVVDKTVLRAGEKASISWSSKNSTGCAASGAWAGARPTSGSFSVSAATPGRFEYVLECRGEGATAKRSVIVAVAYPVLPTSYENKNSLPFDATQIRSIRGMNLKIDSDEQDNNERAVAFADFFGEGRMGAFIVNNRSRNVYGVKDITDSPGKAYFLGRDDDGGWADRTSELLPAAADRDTCVTASFPIIADFNNDRKPDVFLSCEGLSHQLSTGENSGTHPRYPEIYLSNQFVFLSTPGKTYRRVELPFRLRASHASAADVDGDGNVDVALTNLTMVPNQAGPLLLLGNGDGSFRRSDSIIPRQGFGGRNLDWDMGWTHYIHLIPIDGRIDIVMTGSNGAAWFEGTRGGFDPWSLKTTSGWPVSARTNQRYWAFDVVRTGGSFYFTANSNWNNGNEWMGSEYMLIRTDFASRNFVLYPVGINERNGKNNSPWSTQIKLASDGSIVGYTASCWASGGMCSMRVTANSAQTLSDLDTLKYLASQPDLIKAFGADVAKGRGHYEQWGYKEGRKITFDPLIYTASHPDLMLAFGTDEEKAARHYINFGFKEGRVTNAFDPLRYAASHGDLITAFGLDTVSATRNYILFGYAEGRRTTFDALAYIASHGDLISAFATDVVAAIKHYIRAGFNEGRRITFDALAYIASHGDLIKQFGTNVAAATKHYIEWGFREGRQITFSALGYLANNSDLRAIFGSSTSSATQHYINFGYVEKRSADRAMTTPTTRLDAHRFLVQTTFGPTEVDIKRLLEFGYGSQGYERWIDAEIAKPVSLQLPALIALVPANTANMGAGQMHTDRVNLWFKHALRNDDQLRQRVAWALSQIMVVSENGALMNMPFAMADYHDMLSRNAFGNFRKLLEDVTLHPAMGVYLSMLGNQKAVEGTNIRPDENYAREMMQLFSIGLVELNIDGSVKRDSNGQPIPTYNPNTIRGFARVFTGWGSGCPGYVLNNGRTCTFNDARGYDPWPTANFSQSKPMQLYPEQHESGTKQLLVYPGVALPGGLLPAFQGGTRDLKDALDNVFYHPNVGPFISKQLIQKLVTSNPSPAYVRRVAETFNNDGRGSRGNLQEVIKAILLDPEARVLSDSETAGKIKEPLLRLTQLWRAYDAKAPSGLINQSSFCCPVAGSSPVHIFGQSPGQSPSVFNFFSPFYAPPGEIATSGLVAPELQLANENLHTQMGWFFHAQTHWRTNRQLGQQGQDNFYINIDDEMKLADDVDALLDRVSEKLLGSADAMSPILRRQTREQLRRYKNDPNWQDGNGFSRSTAMENTRRGRVSDALFLTVMSPEYAVQR